LSCTINNVSGVSAASNGNASRMSTRHKMGENFNGKMVSTSVGVGMHIWPAHKNN